VRLRLLSLPYDSGHAGARMGRGPGAFRAAGIVEALRADGHRVEPVEILSSGRFPTEIATAFELAGRLAAQVRAALWQGELPLVLSGGCIAAPGILAGLGGDDVGVVWMDAHGDFNTPESSASGFLDGMALAVATGACWSGAAARIPGFQPVSPERVVLVGARDFDPGERERLEDAGVRIVDPVEVAERGGEAAIGTALAGLPSAVRRLYVHIDLDVLDPLDGRANAFAADGGLRRSPVNEILRLLARDPGLVAAAALTAYDPSADPEGQVLDAGVDFARALAGGPVPLTS
jgi:arginase